MDMDELRGALAGVVPEVPPTEGRAASARRRALRRRRRTVMLLSATAVAAAIALPALLIAGDERAVDPADRDLTFDCPGDSASRSPATSAGPYKPIGPGAVLVRMCAIEGFGWSQVPMDGLREVGAAAFTRALRDLVPAQKPTVCELVGRPTYAYLVGYADGSSRFVTSTGGGCGGVSVDGARIGTGAQSDSLLALFKAELYAERARLGGPSERVMLPMAGTCGAHPLDRDVPGFSILEAVPDELAITVLCVPRSGNSEQSTRQVDLSESQADVLERDLRSRVIPADQYEAPLGCRLGLKPPWLVARNVWGDRFQLMSDCSGAYALRMFGPRATARYWVPGPEAADLLRNLAGDTATTLDLPTSSTSPDEVVTVWADLLNVDDARADGLWLRDPPSTSGHITLKVTSLRPEGSPVIDYAWTHAAEVDVIFADDTTADCGEYVERTFTLVRATESEPWRISSWRDKEGPIDGSVGSAAC